MVKFQHAIRATDADGYPNNITRFSLWGEGSGDFLIDPVTGVIHAAAHLQLDHERSSFYNISVRASDSGNLSSTVDVLIFVDNINDNRPEIVKFVPAKGITALGRSQYRNHDTILVCDDGSCSTPIYLEDEVSITKKWRKIFTLYTIS